jgi:hypothetical protein
VYADSTGIKYADTTGFYGGLSVTGGSNNFLWIAIGY